MSSASSLHSLAPRGATPLLDVRDLAVHFDTIDGPAHAVDGVSFSIAAGETLCIVGESGCGKSVSALSIMGLVPRPPGTVTGSIRFEGRELVGLDARVFSDLRGNRLAMIFQEPMTSLNPAFTIGAQLAEVLVRHRGLAPRVAREQAIALLDRVRIPSPASRIDDYPHRLSGGMRQRVMIAMALACEPSLLIADEPTTALDVTIQAQVLELMRELRDDTGTAILLITHDLGVVADMADRVAVMYAGQIVETAPVGSLLATPQHPYTVGLLGAIPSVGARKAQLTAIEGIVPAATAMPTGCRFAARCPFVLPGCRETTPVLRTVTNGHATRCVRSPLEVMA